MNIDTLKGAQKGSVQKLILKAQPKFESGKHNVFTEAINNIALSSIDDKRI